MNFKADIVFIFTCFSISKAGPLRLKYQFVIHEHDHTITHTETDLFSPFELPLWESFHRDHERQALKLQTSWLAIVMLSFEGLNRLEDEKMKITIICSTCDLLKTWNVKP